MLYILNEQTDVYNIVSIYGNDYNTSNGNDDIYMNGIIYYVAQCHILFLDMLQCILIDCNAIMISEIEHYCQ